MSTAFAAAIASRQTAIGARSASAWWGRAPNTPTPAAAPTIAPPFQNFLSRLTVDQRLTLLTGVGSLIVGFGSLIVSFLTYQNAADTSDIKTAIGNLAALATQTERQADGIKKEYQISKDPFEKISRPYLYVDIPYAMAIYNWTHSTFDRSDTGLNYYIYNFGKMAAIVKKSICKTFYIGPSGLTTSIFDDPTIIETNDLKALEGESDVHVIVENGKLELKCNELFAGAFNTGIREFPSAEDRVRLGNAGKLWVVVKVEYEDALGRSYPPAIFCEPVSAYVGYTTNQEITKLRPDVCGVSSAGQPP